MKMKMKSKIKEVAKVAISTVAAVGLFGGLLWGVNARTIQAATEYEGYVPQTVEYVSIPENPIPEDFYASNLTVLNTSFEGEIPSPLALSMEDAAQIGAQYIWDIFGERIDGMYVEMQFAGWDHMSRELWLGSVSNSNRDTVARRNRANELHNEIIARMEAGEDRDYIIESMGDISRFSMYVPGDFYFVIDAITGERIDIWRLAAINNRGFTMEEHEFLNDYIEREWGGDWSLLFAEVTDDSRAEVFSSIAKNYAQIHFTNTVIVDAVFMEAFSFPAVRGTTVTHHISFSFNITDETGRVATVTLDENGALMTITTSVNDIIPSEIREIVLIEVDHDAEGRWVEREE